MTVNNLDDCIANQQTVDRLSVAKLSDKPNAPTAMGGDNMMWGLPTTSSS